MHYDILIIGTGAGGATLAHTLAPSRLRIGILERGGFLPRESENWDPLTVNVRGRYQSGETWFDRHDRPFSPYTHYWVGGNTKVYGSALLRLREDDFGEVRHYGGLSPAWPLSYEDLEPYYTRAERLYCVHGRRGAPGEYPHEPRACEPYPFDPVEHEPRIRELEEDLRALGCRPTPCPLGLRLPSRGPGDAPYRLGRFDGYPDPTEVKADAHVSALRPALEHPNVTLLDGCRALRLITDSGGREVRGAVVRCGSCGDEEMTITADVVVVSCGAINSAALLLASANAAHPRGLANSSGLVGRNYMCHNNGLVIAYTPDAPNASVFQKTLGLLDFYRGAPDSPLPLGTIQLMGRMDPHTLGSMAREQIPDVPAERIAERCVDFFITAEDLPEASNRVELRDDGAIRLVHIPNNLEAYARLEAKLKRLVAAVERRRGRSEPRFLTARLGISGVSHQCGTLRFGTDPRSSVLDVHCRAHDLANLYVVDSSFFPSSGAVNPSLTIMANAIRVGEHLLESMGARVPRESAAA